MSSVYSMEIHCDSSNEICRRLSLSRHCPLNSYIHTRRDVLFNLAFLTEWDICNNNNNDNIFYL